MTDQDPGQARPIFWRTTPSQDIFEAIQAEDQRQQAEKAKAEEIASDGETEPDES